MSCLIVSALVTGPEDVKPALSGKEGCSSADSSAPLAMPDTLDLVSLSLAVPDVVSITTLRASGRLLVRMNS